MSGITFHQFLRHRLADNLVEPLLDYISASRTPIVPDSIKVSRFYVEYMELVRRIQNFRNNTLLSPSNKLLLMINCEPIKVINSSNSLIDMEMLNKRLCNNAQWEIRDISNKKMELLLQFIDKDSKLFKRALPSCVFGKCPEGALSCGQANQMKEKYKNFLNIE